MVYCNTDFDAYISDKYYERLAALTPVARMAEKFRLELEEIPIHFREGDRIAGWFGTEERIDTRNLRVFCDRPTEGEQEILRFPASIGGSISIDKSHICIDYGAVLKRGLVWYGQRIEEERQKEDCEYLRAMEVCVRAVYRFGERIARAAEAEAERQPQERARLKNIAAMARKVPMYPAENFTEALQSVWIMHFLIPLAENAWCSVSLGRFDEYMFPFYEKEKSRGVDDGQITEMLRGFYNLLNHYADAACLLNVGPKYSEFSKLLIACQKSFGMPSPILGARISAETPEGVVESLIDERLFCAGQPTFYSEENCVRALREKGLPAEEAEGFTNNSCMGIGIAGKEMNSMWGCVFNVSAAVEMAINGGKLLRECDGVDCTPIQTTEELFSLFEAYTAENLEKCLRAYELLAKRSEENDPDAFTSVVTDDCIAKHCDRLRGARYHNVTVECMGMVNASDALFAVDKLALREKKYTLSQAVKNNFAGAEEIRADILRCSKYGTDSEADAFAVRVAEMLAKLICRHSRGNLYYMPSLHTLDANVGYGGGWGAGYDGRLSGTPFAKNAGPSNEVRSKDPTALLLSASCLPQYKFFGGQPVDIRFDPATVRTKKQKIAALIRTYFQRGGLQFQVNALSSEVLRDAIAHPEAHRDLIVRIGGYSDYFYKFSPATQREFAERFEREER